MHTDNNLPWISKYVGLKFEQLGRSEGGIDCWGLVRLVYEQELGIILPDYTELYHSVTDKAGIASVVQMAREDSWIKIEEPEPLSVIMLNIYGRPVHVGIVEDSSWFVHSHQDDYSVRERFSDMKWKNRVEGFYRYVKV